MSLSQFQLSTQLDNYLDDSCQKLTVAADAKASQKNSESMNIVSSTSTASFSVREADITCIGVNAVPSSQDTQQSSNVVQNSINTPSSDGTCSY